MSTLAPYVPAPTGIDGRPDPAAEIRMTALAAIRGANYWSRGPVTRLDLAVGAYDEISSADVPGVTERLHAALPGLVEHRCNIGERGGFLARLRHGTYAPHIVEHVALELQDMIGHRVGYGRARGGDVPGEYTVVFEHRHAAVGLRAAALALDVVQRAFAGTLEDVRHAVAELAVAAAAPDAPPVTGQVLCAVTGSALRAETRAHLALHGVPPSAVVVDVSPAYLLQAGLPYARSEAAIVLDVEPLDVPPRYRDSERAARLLGVVVDGVRPGGLVVAPAAARELHGIARDADCRLAIFSATGAPRLRDRDAAHAAAWLEGGRIWREDDAGAVELGPPRADAPLTVQLAALLALPAITGPGVRTRDDEEAIHVAAD